MVRLILLCFFITLILCIAADNFLSTDSKDEIKYFIPHTDAEKLAKCYDDNLNLKIERLERTSQLFDEIILKFITEKSQNNKPTIAQNMTLYFRLLRQTQLDMSADLYKLKNSFMHLNVLNELFKKEMLSLTTNMTKLYEKHKSDIQFLSNETENANENSQLQTREYDEHLNCLKHCSATDKLPETCAEATVDTIFKDDIHVLKLPNSDLQPFYAFCIYENKNEKSWTIIQRRHDGSQNFYRNWTDYKLGFGDVSGEYWLGLERLHIMTKDQPHELWILLVNDKGIKSYLKYSNISIASEDEGYKLTVSNGTGNTDDVFHKHNNQKFATFDKNNTKGCAKNFGSGWWYRDCFYCILNGVYRPLSEGKIYDGIKWGSAYEGIIKYVHMAIRAM